MSVLKLLLVIACVAYIMFPLAALFGATTEKMDSEPDQYPTKVKWTVYLLTIAFFCAYIASVIFVYESVR